ncbi:VWA domain-containing protein BatA [Leptospira sp. GIMC2001]|uniref:VWA domain-containing protein BatA n=1 Tax=Leptospira sp. GIMC2001 TaxID=1513297 RepID=UPI00234A6877|nr:VWA domain-containing protein [Leptospira sp. GIMC2001]WCL47617.1 VWA domain-containing protein [Leptospira sp. GIMC2001]
MSDFERPFILILLVPILLVLAYHARNLVQFFKPFPRQEMNLDHTESKSIGFTFQSICRELFPYLRFLIIALIVFAAAGPGSKHQFLPNDKLGIDIMFALDISGSMVKSRDFLPRNRLEVSKDLVDEFIKKRTTDRLGLVVFAGAAYLQSPLTSDLSALREILSEIDTDTIEEQGTAVGDAILLSTYRLKSSKTKSRVIILLTDGVSNTGKIDPETSSETARAYGIKIYSIGIGKEDGEYEVNFSALHDLSRRSGGKFFRAESPAELESVLLEIDQLEKDILADKPKELIESSYKKYLILAMLLFMLDLGGRMYAFRFYP